MLLHQLGLIYSLPHRDQYIFRGNCGNKHTPPPQRRLGTFRHKPPNRRIVPTRSEIIEPVNRVKIFLRLMVGDVEARCRMSHLGRSPKHPAQNALQYLRRCP